MTITNDQVKDIIVAYLAQGKGPVFGVGPDHAKEAGEWFGVMFNTLKKTVNDQQK